MTTTVSIAPVRKTILVRVAPARAFEVFTSGLSTWWPRTHGIGHPPMKKSVFEPQLGGRWYELAEDGTEATVGKVLSWEPPHRFVVSWDINSQWKPDAAMGSEVEVRFVADAAGTRVELEHRKFEVMGEKDGAKMRQDVDGGWPGMLELFKQAVEA